MAAEDAEEFWKRVEFLPVQLKTKKVTAFWTPKCRGMQNGRRDVWLLPRSLHYVAGGRAARSPATPVGMTD